LRCRVPKKCPTNFVHKLERKRGAKLTDWIKRCKGVVGAFNKENFTIARPRQWWQYPLTERNAPNAWHRKDCVVG